MNIIKIRSYNAIRAGLYGCPPKLAQDLILTRSYPYTHTELQFSQVYGSVSFSSTMEDGVDGCRFRQIGYSTTYAWDTICIPVTDEQEAAIHDKAQEMVVNNQGYDLVGLLSFDIPFIQPSKGKYWCTRAALIAAFAGITLPDFEASILIPSKAHPELCHMVLSYLYLEAKNAI